MNKEIKALLNKITKLRYRMIELQIRIDGLTEAEMVALEKLEAEYDRVEVALHAAKDKMGA
jgi:hypothetical protein